MTSATIRGALPPTPEELIRRARDLVPEIRALAEETERNRTISPHIIARIRDAELLRTTRPKEFGGFEFDPTVALEIALTISAACASTGWAVNGALSNGISFGHYPIETQRELWGDGADPFSCACFAPTGAAVATDWRLCAERQMVVRQRRRPCELDPARRFDQIAGRRPVLRWRVLPAADGRGRDRGQLVRLWPMRHRQQEHHRARRLRARTSRVAVCRHPRRPHLGRGTSPQPALPPAVIGIGRLDAGLDRGRRRQGRALPTIWK